MSHQPPESLVMLPESCHPCPILAKAILAITANLNSPTNIPIIIRCTGYTQETVLTGDFPGRQFMYLEKPSKYITTYLTPGAHLEGHANTKAVYGSKVICPLGLP